jgi:hypothetical protein
MNAKIDIPEKISGNATPAKTILPLIISIILATVFFFATTTFANLFVAKNFLPSNPNFTSANTEILQTTIVKNTSKNGNTGTTGTVTASTSTWKLTESEKNTLTEKLVTLGKKLNMVFVGAVVSDSLCDLSKMTTSECESTVLKYNNDYLETKTGEKGTYRIKQSLVYTIALTSKGPYTLITSTGKNKAINSFFDSNEKTRIVDYAKSNVSQHTDSMVYKRFDTMFDKTINDLRGFGQVNIIPIGIVYIIVVVLLIIFFIMTRRKYSLVSAKWFVQDMNKVYGEYVKEPAIVLVDTKVTKRYIPPSSDSSGGGGSDGGGGGGGGGSSSGGGWG